MADTRSITRFLKQLGARYLTDADAKHRGAPREVFAKMREHATEIFKEGVAAALPERAIRNHLSIEGNHLRVSNSSFDLSRYSRILVAGAGKASASLASAIEELLGERIHAGHVNVKYGHGSPTRKVVVREAGHPLPDEAGVQGTRRIMELLSPQREDSLILCLISGGGSALMVAPRPPLTLTSIQITTRLLLECGASIREINCVRKHLSSVAGGLLAKLAFPATVITLIISDVVGDDIADIASGPTAPDPTTFSAALRVLEKYDVADAVPAEVTEHLMQGVEGRIPETSKPDDPIFERVHNFIIANNHLALEAARVRSSKLGYNTALLSSSIEGDTRQAASFHGAIIREIASTGHPVPPPASILSGGETTVAVRGMGKGGRNQEFVLAAALDLAALPGAVVLSAGTDGTDGPTDAAGAIADSQTLARASELSMDPRKFLEDNNSYNFFHALNDLVITGPTRTNVMDLRVLLVGAPP